MDDDDEMAALAHQQELEAEEYAIAQGRELMIQFRQECKDFDANTEQFWNSIQFLTPTGTCK